MQVLDGRFIFSATDLNNYLECRHLIALERLAALRRLERPERDEAVALVAEKGLQHEQRYFERLRAEGREVVEIAQSDNSFAALERAEADTVAAMARGVSVIYQGTFFDGQFIGKSDFLLRVERPSAKWAWSYEVADTKLALRDKTYFIVQLEHYSEHVARVQGTVPLRMRVVRGNGEERTFLVDDFAAYYRHLKASFLRDREVLDAYPLACAHCAVCDWEALCSQKREDDDHLSLVAGMRRDNVALLEGAQIATMAALAESGAAIPKGMRAPTFERLRRQATLQVRGRTTGRHFYEFLEHQAADGFGQLPAPAPGDVFFDMEGDPLYEIGVGLEYLFGCYCPDDEPRFTAFWGVDRDAERRAFEACVDFLIARRQQYPTMHVYHYAPYEKTALRKLSQRHQTREAEVDFLLRAEVLVDLYAVVRQSLLISQPRYSIKKLEPFYGLERTATVRKGDDSIVKFEKWLQHPEDTEMLADIGHYNEEDCRSTWLLREWLLARRDEAATRFGAVDFRALRDPDKPCHPEFVDGCKKCENRRSEEREAARTSTLQLALLADTERPGSILLGHLLAYHRREEKPGWWRYFDRTENVDELTEHDAEALGGLTLVRDAAPFKRERSLVFTYAYPDQQHRLGVGDKPHDPRTKKTAGEIVHFDEDANRVQIKRSGSLDLDAAALLAAVIPPGPIVANCQKESLVRLAESFVCGELAARHPAALDLLCRALPRLTDRHAGARIQPHARAPHTISPDDVYAVVRSLDRSYLFVQGPPGTGKTYSGARVIAALLRDGKRVGVMANAHKAIHNLLHEVEAVAGALHVPVRGLHKHSSQNPDSPYLPRLAASAFVSLDDNTAAEHGDFNLISGNSWLFARPGMIDRLDYLVIDEAGQTSLADALAVAPCAHNVILLGDPMQLAQVSQGVHGGGAGRSVLHHLLGDAATVAENRGILLDTSYRMQPQICDFISETVYDRRLNAQSVTRNNRIDAPGLTGSGLRYLPVEHAGNGAESSEEAARIVAEIDRLLRGTFVRKDEPEANLTQRDILVVTPYNAQRRLISQQLRDAGYGDLRVGTVDKFQGQEAPVVFYSMATSSGEDVPRDLDFLFEKNRFNVAVSRAQCLSVLVCCPRLLDVRAHSVEQMALVNLLCRFVEAAEAAAPSSPAEVPAVAV